MFFIQGEVEDKWFLRKDNGSDLEQLNFHRLNTNYVCV